MISSAIQSSKLCSPHSLQVSEKPIDWKWLDSLPLIDKTEIGNLIAKEITCKTLKNTLLNCSLSTAAGSWENRLAFIKEVVADIFQKCPKDEELSIISLGSGHLLMEYILGKALVENGFQKISFHLIDPSYCFSTSEKGKINTQKRLKEFRELLSSAYAEKWNEPFPKEWITYLSRAKNVEKYFAVNSNVVLIQSLPPYGQILNTMPKYNLPSLSAQEMFMGNIIVPKENANAIAFLPTHVKDMYVDQGACLNEGLPLVVFKNKNSNSNYCFDWGCKIYSDGRFFVNFFGGMDYFQSFEEGKNAKIEINRETRVPLNQLTASIKKLVEEELQEKIDVLKKDNPDKMLSQKEISTLILHVEEMLKSLEMGCESFYLADFSIDRSELVSFLTAKAGHRYRKGFSLVADPQTVFKIDVEVL